MDQLVKAGNWYNLMIGGIFVMSGTYGHWYAALNGRPGPVLRIGDIFSLVKWPDVAVEVDPCVISVGLN